ncbi:flagellar hook basal-body protein [Thioclava sp. BHET1]|nr:flagellar hook basal-body protein [Thioclava sp. BHET1]
MALGGLYTTMAGLETSAQRLDTVSQNLANVNTQGYAAAQTRAMALPYVGTNPVPGADVISLGENADTRDGPIEPTGAPLDVAVQGGWLVVQTQSGDQALTRNGHLATNSANLLVTATGAPVLGASGRPISLPALRNVTIAPDGTISGIAAGVSGGRPQAYGKLLLAQTPAGGNLVPLGNSLYGLPPGATAQASDTASVQQGALEGSNVNSVNAMMDLISVSKTYQLETQVMGKSAATETALDQILMS